MYAHDWKIGNNWIFILFDLIFHGLFATQTIQQCAIFFSFRHLLFSNLARVFLHHFLLSFHIWNITFLANDSMNEQNGNSTTTTRTRTTTDSLIRLNDLIQNKLAFYFIDKLPSRRERERERTKLKSRNEMYESLYWQLVYVCWGGQLKSIFCLTDNIDSSNRDRVQTKCGEDIWWSGNVWCRNSR